ncbi:MAG: hypothetical protein AAGC81_18690 [Pseudomonadota bacterium]
MTFVLKWINRAVGLTLLVTAAALTTGLALALIASQLIGEEAFIDRLTCQLGLSETCVHERLEDSQRHLERQRRESKRLRERIVEMDAVLGRLRELDRASSSYVIFYRDKTGPLDVVTGHQYASLLDPGTLTSGWCYIDVGRGSALSGSLHIARFDADLKLHQKTVGSRDRQKAGVSEDAVKDARARCTWPEGIS